MHNIFIKSILRRPMRTALLMLLIALSAFALTMRGAEYLMIRESVKEIGEYYRAIGFLTPDNPKNNDVLAGAELIESSPYIAFEDRRRGFAGVLQEMQNSDIGPIFEVYRANHQEMFKDVFFYGELVSKTNEENGHTARGRGQMDVTMLTVVVDEVIVGHPEHTYPGQTLILHFYPDEIAEDLYTPHLNPFRHHGVTRDRQSLDGMEIGQRYLFRAVYHFNEWMYARFGPPQIGRQEDILAMRPLNERITIRDSGRRELHGEALWYVLVPQGEMVDLFTPGLENLEEEIEGLRLSQSTVRVETTVDMTAVPYMQPTVGVHRIVEGRAIDRSDYEVARPVAVIHNQFANIRDISVGDTIRIEIPEAQYIAGVSFIGDIFSIQTGHVHQFAVPEPGRVAWILELEVVGLYRYFQDTGMHVEASTLIYIPDSLLPHTISHIELQQYEDGRIGFNELGISGVAFQMPFWYSFMLEDPRNEDAFLLGYREALAAIGLSVGFIPTNAVEFWNAAEPILQSALFNLIAFSGLACLLFVFISFLYLRQSRKEFAIMRALGISKRITHRQQSMAICVITLPSTIVGGAVGWLLALQQASNTLSPLREIATESEFARNAPTLPFYWLIFFLGLSIAALLTIVVIGSIQMSRHPVLELLQGNVTRQKNQVQSMNIGTIVEKNEIKCSIHHNTQTKTVNIKQNVRCHSHVLWMIRFVRRHMIRAKGKSLLMTLVALFFVAAIGYLQETILRSEININHLYETTVVNAEIRSSSLVPVMHRGVGNIIAQRTIEAIKDSNFVRNVYVEAGQEYAVMFRTTEDGGFPENWDEIAGIDLTQSIVLHLDMFQPLLAFDDMETFLAAHSRNFLDEMPGTQRVLADGRPMGDIEIEFASGLSESAFVFTEGMPIPIILSAQVIAEQELSIGDIVYLATTLYDTRSWTHARAQIIGVHNRNITHIAPQLLDATFVPQEALEYMLGGGTGYITLAFEIDPTYSREISMIREYLEHITGHPAAGFAGLELLLWDEELRMVAAPMEQNLSLLRQLYPAAIGVSILIGLGLSMLLMLQNAKNAAIMRVLGGSLKKSRAVLCAEQLTLCLLGLLLGLCALTVLNWGFSVASVMLVAGLYLGGVAIGAFVGAVLVTNRPPLELLQVKE